jgi:DNA-binding NarL/FixJ family response regulator
MGRQKRYHKRILVRLTSDEYGRLIERAKRDGVSLSRLLVETTLADKGVSSAQKEETERLIEQRDWGINQLVRLGNNVNQIARQLNSQTGTISARRIERVLNATLDALIDLRRTWEHAAAD